MRSPTPKTTLALAALAALLPFSAAQADEKEAPPKEKPPLETDRPDFTEAAVVVPLGSLQIESGLTYTNDAGGVNSFNAPEMLLRWGAWQRTELRFLVPDYVRLWGSRRTSGFGDLTVGFKHQLGPVGGFDLALVGGASLPSGSSDFSTGAVDPEGSVVWARDLSERWGVGGQFAFLAPRVGGRRQFTWAPTLVVEYSLSKRVGTFLEYAGEFAEGSGDVHLVHHGYRFQPTDTTQWDIHFGFGVSRAAPDFFLGGGYSVRF